MTLIDRDFVKKSFNAGAKTYDCYAGLQNDMNGRLVAAYCSAGMQPGRLLDIGMGTGNLTMRLAQRFPNAQVCGCDLALSMLNRAKQKLAAAGARSWCAAADAEQLPYRAGCFDLVVSGFTYQWLDDWTAALNEVRRVLRPGGIFVFSAFGAQTFHELRQAYRKACAETGYNRGEALQLATTMDTAGRALACCGFVDIRLEALQHVSFYPGVNDLVRAVKGMGARNASARRHRTPGVRAIWKRLTACYEQACGGPAGIPATFEIIMGAARTP